MKAKYAGIYVTEKRRRKTLRKCESVKEIHYAQIRQIIQGKKTLSGSKRETH